MTVRATPKPAPRWLEIAEGWAPLALVVICTLWAAVQLYFVATMDGHAPGYETERVARALSRGQGFSLPNNHRWLFDPEPGVDATAWVDPVFVTALAGMYSKFSERAPEVALCLNVAAVVGCFMVLFMLVQRFAGAFVAVIAVALLALEPWFRIATLGVSNSAWGALMIAITALTLVRALEKPTALRCVILGVCSGFAALTYANSLLFVPAIAILLATLAPGTLARRVRAAVVAFVLACATIAPWTLRNVMEFDEFVPVRTGAGQLAHVGLVMLGSTIVPESANLPVDAGWHASSPRAAVFMAARTDGRNALERAQREVFRAAPPPGYDDMNEAQRDREHLRAARDYALRNPMLTALMGVFKLELFARRLGTMGLLTILAAYVSVFFLYRDRKVLALGTLFVVYALPFTIFVAYFHRYRAPIEPIVVALACIGGARLVAWLAVLQREAPPNRSFSRFAPFRRAA